MSKKSSASNIQELETAILTAWDNLDTNSTTYLNDGPYSRSEIIAIVTCHKLPLVLRIELFEISVSLLRPELRLA